MLWLPIISSGYGFLSWVRARVTLIGSSKGLNSGWDSSDFANEGFLYSSLFLSVCTHGVHVRDLVVN